jgi:hypothetical protein
LLGDSDPSLLVDFAEVLAQGNNGNMLGRPEQLVMRALEIEPGLTKGLWLAGFAAMQREDHAAAIRNWSQLLRGGRIDEESRVMLESYIAESRAKLGITDRQDVATTIEPVDVDLSGSSVTLPASVKVEVSLDPSLTDKVNPNEVVYVFARATSGMPAPLAVKNLTVADLPTTVVLDDGLAMMPGHNLSSKEEVIVGARISRTGTPMAQPGDLQGISEPVATHSADAVNIVINREVTDQAAATAPSIKVQVSLDPSLEDKTGRDQAVFVFARATSGMPAPLAVKKLTVADLPATVVLDDTMAMMQGHNLSSKEEVIVGARVSRSGKPISQPGDLQGLSGALLTRATDVVNIVINQVIDN